MRKKLLIWLLAIIMGGAAIGGAGYYYREPIKNAANHCYQQIFHRNSNAQEPEPTPEPEENAAGTRDEEYVIQLQEKQLRINALETAIADLNQTIDELNTANDASTARLTDLTARKTELEAQVAELQDTNAAITAEKQAEIDALNLSLADLQSEIDTLNTDNADYIEQLAELTNRKTELENQVTKLQGDIETLQTQVDELSASGTVEVVSKWVKIDEWKNINGKYVWEDCEGNVYFSYGNYQYKLNQLTNEWEQITWTGLSSLNGNNIWRCEDKICYSPGGYKKNIYVLGPDNMWNCIVGDKAFVGEDVWYCKRDGVQACVTISGETYCLALDGDGISMSRLSELDPVSGYDYKGVLCNGKTYFFNTSNSNALRFEQGESRSVYMRDTEGFGVRGVTVGCVFVYGDKMYHFNGRGHCAVYTDNYYDGYWCPVEWIDVPDNLDGQCVFIVKGKLYFADGENTYELTEVAA